MYFYLSSNWRKQRTSVLFLIYLAAFIGIILFSLPGISAAQVTLSWDANTEPNLAGYKVYYGVSSGNYQPYKDVGKTTTTSISSLQSGSTYYFAITAYDHSGSESEYSNEVSYTPGPGCPYEISPAMQSFESSGGTGKVSVTTPTGCSWSVFSNASWLLLTSNSTQTGNSTVNFSVSSHTGSTSRSGTLTVAGKTFTVNQSGVECSYSISPASQSLGSGGGTGTVNVTTSTGCPWSASSGTSWITITSGKTGTGNGTAGYSVSANSGISSRTGSLTVAGKTFTVNQSGVECSYSISPASQSLGSGGGTGTVNVTTSTGCPWSASSPASSGTSWITITSGKTGTGNGTAGYSVSANSGISSRTGTLTVAGKTFTVNQSGVECSYSISPASQSLGSGGGTGTVNVTTSTGCPWSASQRNQLDHYYFGKNRDRQRNRRVLGFRQLGNLIQDRNPDCCREDLHGESIRRGVQLFHLSRQPVPRLRRRDGNRQRDHLHRLPLECLQSRF